MATISASATVAFLIIRFFNFDGLGLTRDGDLEVLRSGPSTNFDKNKKLDITSETPLLGKW